LTSDPDLQGLAIALAAAAPLQLGTQAAPFPAELVDNSPTVSH